MFSNHHIFKCLACIAGVSKSLCERYKTGSVKKNLHKGNETRRECKKLGSEGGGEASEGNSFCLHPLPTSPQFLAHPGHGPSLTCFLACLFDLRLVLMTFYPPLTHLPTSKTFPYFQVMVSATFHPFFSTSQHRFLHLLFLSSFS